MIQVKFPFDIKYFDVFEDEAVVVNLTLQGGQVTERQCVDIAFMLLVKEGLKNIMIYNPEREDTHFLMKSMLQKRDSFDSSIRVREVVDYEV